MKRLSRPQMVGAAFVGVIVSWLAVTYGIGPRLIRAAYEGRSIDLFNHIIQGQTQHPVEDYLAAFQSLANRTMGLLLIAGTLLLLGYSLRGPIGTVSRWINRPGPQVAPREAVLACLWIGIVLGGAEAVITWVHWRSAGVITNYTDPKVFWMAPLAQGILFLLLSAIVIRLLRFREPTVSGSVILSIFISLGLAGIAVGGIRRLHPIAVLLLSAGMGLRSAVWLAKKPRWWRLTQRTAVLLVVVLAVLGIGFRTVGRWMRQNEIKSLTEPTEGMPNVLLLVLDTVRGENLGLLGYSRPTTPSIARHASRGVVFEHGIAPATWTLPTHASLMTGRYHGELNVSWQTPLDRTQPVLAEFLREHGAATGGFVANVYNTNRATGLGRGFIEYEDYALSPAAFATSTWATTNTVGPLWNLLTGRRVTTRKYAPAVNAEFLRWLEGVGERPFFAFLNYFDAHDPYEFFQEAEAVLEQGQPTDTVIQEDGTFVKREERLAGSMDRYDTAITFMDLHIGRLLDSLDVLGLLDRTIVIITSDHGEHFGEHEVIQHSRSLYTQLVGVPLIIIYRPLIPQGTRIAHPVSLRDVAATVVGLAGLEGSPFPGSSLARFWNQEGGGASDPSPVLSEAWPNPRWVATTTGPIRHGPMRSIVVGSLHFIQNGNGTEELYDLFADPREERDLAGLPIWSDSLEQLRSLLGPRRD